MPAELDATAVAQGLAAAGWADQPLAWIDAEPLVRGGGVLRLHLGYDAPCRRLDGRNPASVVCKAYAGVEDELAVYGHLQRCPGAPAPRAAPMVVDGRPIALLMTDLRAGQQRRQATELDAHAARVAVDRLARLHAAFWQDPQLVSLPTPHAPSIRGDWAARVAQAYPRAGAMLERAEAVLPCAPRARASSSATLVHGDPTQSNIIVAPHDVRFVDWKHAHRGQGVVDLALLLAGGVAAEVRRHHEWTLLLRYHAGLVRGGVAGYGQDDCWTDYRAAIASALRGAIAGFDASGTDEAARVVTRCAAALLDGTQTTRAAA